MIYCKSTSYVTSYSRRQAVEWNALWLWLDQCPPHTHKMAMFTLLSDKANVERGEQHRRAL